MGFKLGRKPATFNYASIVKGHIMARALSDLGAPPPFSPDWTYQIRKQRPDGAYGMHLNDTYGCCVIADCANQEQLRTANVGTIWSPSDTDVMRLYAKFQGYIGDFTNTFLMRAYLSVHDLGCNESDVIAYEKQSGWQGRLLDNYANIDPTNVDHIKWAISMFGASRLGVNLPSTAMEQTEAGKPWDYVAGAKLDGGHDVPAVMYSHDGTIYVLTWDRLQPVTPAFFSGKYADGTPYIEEAHVELAYDWANKVGVTPAKLDMKTLEANLSAVGAPPVQPSAVRTYSFSTQTSFPSAATLAPSGDSPAYSVDVKVSGARKVTVGLSLLRSAQRAGVLALLVVPPDRG